MTAKFKSFVTDSHRIANVLRIGYQLGAAKSNRPRRGGRPGGEFQQRRRRDLASR